MYNTTQVQVSTNAEKKFNSFLFLYPERYRKQYGNEMRLVFHEIYQEELAKNGKIGIGFWLSQIGDITKSVIEEHIDEIGKRGMKKYLRETLNLNKFNIFGAILLAPFLLLLGADFVTRIMQGDLFHYNRAWYSVMSHTILYSTFNGHAYLLWTALILAPMLAVVLNLIPIVISIKPIKKLTIKALFLKNPLAIVIVGVGLFALLIIYGHDFFPCIVHGLLNGSVNKEHILSICSKA